MITRDNFKKLREEVKSRSILNNKQKYIKRQYMYMPIEKVSSHQKDRLRQETFTCVLNLFYYYCKHDGLRSAKNCFPNYSKDHLSNLVNSFDIKIDYDNLQNLHEQKGQIKTDHRTTRYLSIYCFDQEPSRFALKLIKEYIAGNKEDLILEYNKFCDWIVKSSIATNYLKNVERAV